MSNGGGKSTVTKENVEPWKPQQPWLKKGFKETNRIYNEGQAQGPWTGDFYAPEDPGTAAARDAAYSRAASQVGYLDPAMAHLNARVQDPSGGHFINTAANTYGQYQGAADWTNQVKQQMDFSGLDQFNQNLGQFDVFGKGTGPGGIQGTRLATYGDPNLADPRGIQGTRLATYGDPNLADPRGIQGTRLATYGDQALADPEGIRGTRLASYGGMGKTVPTSGLTQDVLEATLRGDFLNAESNPYLQSAMTAATDPLMQQLLTSTLPQTDSQAILQGAYGGNANAVQRGRAIGDTERAALNTRATMAAENFARERGIQTGMSEAERGRLTAANEAERNRALGIDTAERAYRQANFGRERDRGLGVDVGERAYQQSNFQNERNRGFDVDTRERGYQQSNFQAERNRGFDVDTRERGYQQSNYNTERDRMLNAMQSKFGLNLEGLRSKYGFQLADEAQASDAVFNAANMEAGRNQMLMNAGLNINQQGLSAASLLPGMYSAGMQPYNDMQGLVAQNTAAQQRALENERMKWAAPMDAAWNNLGRYQQGIGGNLGQSGTQTLNTSGGINPAIMGAGGGALMGGMGGAGLASMMGLTMAANPYLLPLMVGGGALMGGMGGWGSA